MSVFSLPPALGQASSHQPPWSEPLPGDFASRSEASLSSQLHPQPGSLGAIFPIFPIRLWTPRDQGAISAFPLATQGMHAWGWTSGGQLCISAVTHGVPLPGTDPDWMHQKPSSEREGLVPPTAPTAPAVCQGLFFISSFRSHTGLWSGNHSNSQFVDKETCPERTGWGQVSS